MKDITRYIFIKHFSPFAKRLPCWYLEKNNNGWEFTCDGSTNNFAWLEKFEMQTGRYEMVSVVMTRAEFEFWENALNALAQQKIPLSGNRKKPDKKQRKLPDNFLQFLHLIRMHKNHEDAAKQSKIGKSAAQKAGLRLCREYDVHSMLELYDVLDKENRL